MKVYLAGYINDKKMDECAGWREDVVDYYRKQSYPIEFLDPLNGKNLDKIQEGGLSAQDLTDKAILGGDMLSVRVSDIIVANLDKFGEQRDMSGTISEMAISWWLRKPIITITHEDQYLKHPFIKEFSSVFVSSVDELLEKKWINYYYKRMNNAIY